MRRSSAATGAAIMGTTRTPCARRARRSEVKGGASIRSVVAKYGAIGATFATLRRHVQGQSSPSKATGRQPSLSVELEDALAEWVIKAWLHAFSPIIA